MGTSYSSQAKRKNTHNCSVITTKTSTYFCLFYPLLLPFEKLKRKFKALHKKRQSKKLKKKLRQVTMPRCSTFSSNLTLLTPTKRPFNDAHYEQWKTKLEHSICESITLSQHTQHTDVAFGTPLSQRALLKDTDTIVSGQLTPKGFPAHTDKLYSGDGMPKARRKLHLPTLPQSPGVIRRKQMQRQMQHDKQQQNQTPPKEQQQIPKATIKQAKHTAQPKQCASDLNDSQHIANLYYKSQLFCSISKEPTVTWKQVQQEMHDLEVFYGARYEDYYW